MEQLVMKRRHNSFLPVKSTSDAIHYLGGFLSFDVGGSVDYIRKAFNDPKEQQYEWGYGGYAHIEQKNDQISIGFAIDQFNETPGAPVFELTLKQMDYILDRWQEALEKKPNKIIITKDDNGEIKVEFED
jgi:hypothetical protein